MHAKKKNRSFSKKKVHSSSRTTSMAMDKAISEVAYFSKLLFSKMLWCSQNNRKKVFTSDFVFLQNSRNMYKQVAIISFSCNTFRNLRLVYMQCNNCISFHTFLCYDDETLKEGNEWFIMKTCSMLMATFFENEV